MTKLIADTLSTALRKLGWVTEVRACGGPRGFEVRVTGKTSGGARLPS